MDLLEYPVLLKVLIVDDEESIGVLLERTLKNHGFETHIALNAEKALEILHETSFDILLTDVMMPGMNGIELILKAKEINPAICCVVMTGYASVSSAAESMRKGVLDYLTKPFDLNDLTRALVEARDRQLQQTLEIEQRTKEKLNNLDPLTGLCNPRLFHSALEAILDQNNSKFFPLTIVLLDVDRLRSINKAHGLNAGDDVLRKIAQVIQKKFPPPSLPCRYGGDEFLVMLPKTSKEKAIQEIEAVNSLLSNPGDAGDESVRFSTSAGYATCPQEGTVGHMLIQAAQRSLQEFKQALKSS